MVVIFCLQQQQQQRIYEKFCLLGLSFWIIRAFHNDTKHTLTHTVELVPRPLVSNRTVLSLPSWRGVVRLSRQRHLISLSIISLFFFSLLRPSNKTPHKMGECGDIKLLFEGALQGVLLQRGPAQRHLFPSLSLSLSFCDEIEIAPTFFSLTLGSLNTFPFGGQTLQTNATTNKPILLRCYQQDTSFPEPLLATTERERERASERYYSSLPLYLCFLSLLLYSSSSSMQERKGLKERHSSVP
eukprot:gene1620-990_t